MDGGSLGWRGWRWRGWRRRAHFVVVDIQLGSKIGDNRGERAIASPRTGTRAVVNGNRLALGEHVCQRLAGDHEQPGRDHARVYREAGHGGTNQGLWEISRGARRREMTPCRRWRFVCLAQRRREKNRLVWWTRGSTPNAQHSTCVSYPKTGGHCAGRVLCRVLAQRRQRFFFSISLG